MGVADGVARGAAVAREGDEARDVPGDLGEGAREGRLVRGCPRRDRPGHVVVGDVRGGLATLRQAVDPDRELREGVGELGVVPHGHVQTAELAEGAEQIGERQSARRARRVHRGVVTTVTTGAYRAWTRRRYSNRRSLSDDIVATVAPQRHRK